MNEQAHRALERAIKAAGGTQAALARCIGCTQQAVGQWRKGQSRPSLVMAIEMQGQFGIKGEHFRPEDARLFKQLRRQTNDPPHSRGR